MRIYNNVTELIGHTPLVRLNTFASNRNLKADIVAKIESFNPAGSIKDRIALSMLMDAHERGLIAPGSLLIEPTSGNTGVGIAMVAAALGYKALFTMPETMTVERRNMLKAYGAKLELTPGALGMKGAIARAEELNKENPGSFMLRQFDNPANPRAHLSGTGPEIWSDTDGQIDILVAGVGTGGTVSGTGRFLKSKNPSIEVVAVEPAGSPVLTEGRPGAHKIQGIGAGFVPATLDTGVYDRVMTVSDEDAFSTARALVHEEGVLAGISSGAALFAAAKLAALPENEKKTIVVILPDSGDRYLSTALVVHP